MTSFVTAYKQLPDRTFKGGFKMRWFWVSGTQRFLMDQYIHRLLSTSLIPQNRIHTYDFSQHSIELVQQAIASLDNTINRMYVFLHVKETHMEFLRSLALKAFDALLVQADFYYKKLQGLDLSFYNEFIRIVNCYPLSDVECEALLLWALGTKDNRLSFTLAHKTGYDLPAIFQVLGWCELLELRKGTEEDRIAFVSALPTMPSASFIHNLFYCPTHLVGLDVDPDFLRRQMQYLYRNLMLAHLSAPYYNIQTATRVLDVPQWQIEKARSYYQCLRPDMLLQTFRALCYLDSMQYSKGAFVLFLLVWKQCLGQIATVKAPSRTPYRKKRQSL